jgi:hypothetical protein
MSGATSDAEQLETCLEALDHHVDGTVAVPLRPLEAELNGLDRPPADVLELHTITPIAELLGHEALVENMLICRIYKREPLRDSNPGPLLTMQILTWNPGGRGPLMSIRA